MKTKLIDLALIVVILVFSVIIVRQVKNLLFLTKDNIPNSQPEKVAEKNFTSNNDPNSIPEKVAEKKLYEPPEAAATVPHSREDSTVDFETRLPNLETGRAQALEPLPSNASAAELQHIQDFIMWCQKHSIKLVGIKKNAIDLYFKGAEEEDYLPIADIQNLREVALGLYEIPEILLTVMEGKIFYLSNQLGRGNAVTASWPKKNILTNVNRGVILEQPLTKRQTIHEFAHILDFHGIQGIYNDQKNYWWHLKSLRDEVFAVSFAYEGNRATVPAGYMDIYSTANPAENFAQHFMYYILYGEDFRNRAQNDMLLQKKYDFFKDHLFNYLEYGL